MEHNYRKQFKNINIRPLSIHDIEYLRKWRNNPKNTKYLNELPYITPKMQQSWFEKYLRDDDEITFAIDEILDIKNIVGSIALYNIEKDRIECGKIMVGDERAHGKNVGTNALKAVLKLAFEDMHFEEVYLHVYEANKPAVKTYLKAGLHIVNKHATEKGMEYIMSIRRDEYAQYE